MKKITHCEVPITIEGRICSIVFDGPDLNVLDSECDVTLTGELTPRFMFDYMLRNARGFPYADLDEYEGHLPFDLLNTLDVFGLKFQWPPEIVIPEKTELEELRLEVN